MYKRVALILLASMLLASCTSKPAQANIFDNPICKPPCWQNITPGVTAKKEALVVLSKISAVSQQIVDLNRSSVMGFDDEIRFTFYNDDNFNGYMYMLDDHVSMIAFGNGFARQMDITLQHAIELFGMPQSILVVHSSYYDPVTLLNVKKGIAFGYNLTGTQNLDTSEIEPGTRIANVIFFDPNQYEQVLISKILSASTLSGDQIKNNLRPWNGYGSFKEKYWPPATP